jgi:hypothetical protein
MVSAMRAAIWFGIITFATTSLLACLGSGDDSENETAAWVRIDSPSDGFSTGAETITLEGNAGMRDGSYPDTVYWVNDGLSDALPQSTICLIGCVAAFRGEVPLFPGENTISVQLLDGVDTVSGTRYPQVVVSGSVWLDTDGLVPGITVTLSGDRDSSITFESGSYSFSGLRDGSYSLSASLLPAQGDCFSFAPDRHNFDIVDFDDITGLDFTATRLAPCYEVSGRISASTNPDASLSDIRMLLKDQDDNTYVVYSGFDGYIFRNLGPGTYTVKPSDSFGGVYTPEQAVVTITDDDILSVDFVRKF